MLFPIALLKLIRYLFLLLGAFVIGISLSLAVVNGIDVLVIILCHIPSSILIYVCFSASSAISDDIQLIKDLEPEDRDKNRADLKFIKSDEYTYNPSTKLPETKFRNIYIESGKDPNDD